MKARDLAALAALGLGGAYLYNRNKGDATPKGAETVRGGAADFVNRGAAPAAAKEDITPAEMPAYQGRSADRREDIQSEYGGDMSAGMGRRGAGESDRGPVPNAMGVPDTEVYKRSEMDDLKGVRMPTRPGQSTSGMVKRPVAAAGAAPLSSGRKPSVSQATMNTAKSQEIVDRMAARARLRKGIGDEAGNDMKRGGAVKKMASGGSVSSASSRGDGIAQRGKTRGRMC